MCGKVIGYQVESPDGPNNNNIIRAYIDGVSLTYGSPRKHIWSFIGGVYENPSFCPCGTSGQWNSSVLTITVSLVIITAIITVHYTVLIHSGMVKVVVVLRNLVVLNLVFLGFINNWVILQLTPLK